VGQATDHDEQEQGREHTANPVRRHPRVREEPLRESEHPARRLAPERTPQTSVCDRQARTEGTVRSFLVVTARAAAIRNVL
jgi:hypothetical protein